MNSTRIASAVLCWAAPDGWRESLLGDLEEESAVRGQRWYWSQVARSMAPMIASRLITVNWQMSLLAIAIAAAGQIALIDRGWSMVLSAIPLKADVVRGTAYMAASWTITLLVSCLAGLTVTRRGLAAAIPAAVLFNVLGLAAMRGITPAWFWPATMLATVVGITSGSVWRRRVL